MTEEAENNSNDGAVGTNHLTSIDLMSIKNDKDSNNINTYYSLRNYNTKLFSTNSSSICHTSNIN